MYVPEWFVVLSILLCIVGFIVLITLLSMWINSIVRFVEECHENFERVKYHGERMNTIQKQLDIHGTRIYEIEKQMRRCRKK